MAYAGEIEERANELEVLRDSARCVKCERPLSARYDQRCPSCGGKKAVLEDDLVDAPFACEDCNFSIYDAKSLKRCPMCKGKRVRRAKVNVTSMPSIRTHPYSCKKCGNPFTTRDVERMAFCDCGSREVIDRRRSKENPAEPIFYTCENCLEECSLSDRRCASCGVGKRAYRTVETWG